MNFDNEDSINFIKNFSQENISDFSIINYFNKNEFIRKKFLNLKKIQKQKINEKIIFLKQFHKKNIKDSYENTYRKNYKSKSVSLNNQSTNNQSSSKNLSKILFTSNKYLIHSPSNSNINRHFLTLSPIKNKQLKKNHIKIHFDNNSFHKEKYGKLYLFKEQVKKIRHEKFIHNILENEFYFKKFENENKVQYFENLKYNYSKNLKLFNEFYENFNKYYKYLLINIERGKLKNIELNKKKIEIRNDIQNIYFKKEKLMRVINDLMNKKKFLLCVKEKNIIFEKLSKETQNEINKDEERKKLIKNNYIIKKKKSQNNLSINTYNNDIIKSFSKRKNSTNIINEINHTSFIKSDFNNYEEENYYFPIENKNIFDNVEDFEIIFNNINHIVTGKLNKYNGIKNEINILKRKLKEVDDEKKEIIEKYYKRIDEDLRIKIEKVKILKQKNVELIQTKKKLIEDISNTNYLIDNILEEKIQEIFALLNIKIEKNYYSNQNLNLIKLKIIEITFNNYSIEKNLYKKNNPEDYKKIHRMSFLKNRIYLIEKRKSIENEKQKEKINKIIERQNKIYFLPSHKFNSSIVIKKKKNKK
jgi:hypothetical protein